MEVTNPHERGLMDNELNSNFTSEMIDAAIEEEMEADPKPEEVFSKQLYETRSFSALFMSILQTASERGPGAIAEGLVIAILVGVILERHRAAAEAEQAAKAA